jgi:predicted transcriptional regulator
MLEALFGNKSAVKVMLAIFNHEELHASAIAKTYSTALDPIKKQLERFEEAGFLNSRVVGRSRLYRFNESHPLHQPLKDLLLIANQDKNIKVKNKPEESLQ